MYVCIYIHTYMYMIQVGYAMIVVALFWSDVAILHKFNNVALMTQYDNRAVALIEAGSLIGLYVHVCVCMYMYVCACRDSQTHIV